MLVSKKWLEEYTGKLQGAQELAETLTMRAFEVENVESRSGDEVLDVKILPNRAHDCLCHRGVAREIAALLDKKFTDREVPNVSVDNEKEAALKIKIDDAKLCPRYMGKRIENLSVKDSPDWLRQKLEVLGERSISNVVDITNFIMLDLGQPMHAFDADKVQGDIHVRLAREGEKIILLTGEEVVLDNSILLIADEEGPLALAGVKGGKKAEVTASTKNIILESANFHPALIRKTSQKLGIKNNSSKRYENGLSPELAASVMGCAVKLVSELAASANTKVYKTVDVYGDRQKETQIDFSLSDMNKLLGAEIKEAELEEILRRTGWQWEKTNPGEFRVTIPLERLDLTIKEDLVEEIGRIYGYEKIKAAKLETLLAAPKIDTNLEMSQKVRFSLAKIGYSEVYNYAFRSQGDIKIENPIASDRAFLRQNLTDGLKDSLEFNYRNAPFLGLQEIKIFEIGAVFQKGGEKINVAWGIKNKKETKIEEYDLVEACEKLAATARSDIFSLLQKPEVKFRPISQYPFVLRDIAVWTPAHTDEKEALKIIKQNAGELLVRDGFFDRFEKDGKISLAFNLVFQSQERTLTDAEINSIMQKITEALNSQDGWQVR